MTSIGEIAQRQIEVISAEILETIEQDRPKRLAEWESLALSGVELAEACIALTASRLYQPEPKGGE